ncbi:uncharacterized protein LOC114432377 [Parambassis ranga]|uniref:Uncharacterized protein LOC114432377 n=1 Tax=Parambassis ranga TaxID=210632 RepID=A0A6P7HKQ0_9TELE|nr:uncharacterized protein LOC114432377 [Parambassis ranga]
MTNMAGWKLCLVLLLMPNLCTHSEASREVLFKSISKDPDITPLCDNKTNIPFVVCKIRTERSSREECRLQFKLNHGFNSSTGCDSRFTLMNNQTVFLHLINLTPEDSGNYTCVCSYQGGIHTLYLSITVEGGEEDAIDSAATSSFNAVSAVMTFIGTAAVVLHCIYRKMIQRKQPETKSSYSTTAVLYMGAESTDSMLMQRESRLYSAVQYSACTALSS